MTTKKKSPQKTVSGTYRQKRSDTKMRTIERKYGKDFAVRGDMKLGTFLKKNKYGSLSQLLKKNNAKPNRK